MAIWIKLRSVTVQKPTLQLSDIIHVLKPIYAAQKFFDVILKHTNEHFLQICLTIFRSYIHISNDGKLKEQYSDVIFTILNYVRYFKVHETRLEFEPFLYITMDVQNVECFWGFGIYKFILNDYDTRSYSFNWFLMIQIK